MNTKLLILFIALNIVVDPVDNARPDHAVDAGKTVAAVVNAVAYGLYTVVVVYTVCDLPLWLKVVVVGACNLVGVFCVKWGEEKARKDKLWKVEATVKPTEAEAIKQSCKALNVPFSYIDINKYVIFNFYCATQSQSALIKGILNNCKAKYFVSESKTL